jgi:hypothetical protein
MRAPLKHGNHAVRALRASVTSLWKLLHRAPVRHRNELELETRKLRRSVDELERLLGLERAALDEPHTFEPPALGIWCTRCGGTRDQLQLHPPEMQVTNDAAHAAQGGA